ncbi:PIN domain-containing protein [Burkholderia sp. WP9]|jgi:predicted nucleic acid-binding protein|uniref:PIN domain-containing protein n=1 Tax=Burkholderiaceae TaxID=119060 RepID=UPI0008983A77|nr:PIN domain-containing protein [Burkholderia sp. WP9]SEF03881.1 PIN domain-containing protein [Burkholderia sp. WP9]
MLSVDRFTVVLDACSLFPMVVRDVLLTFADHEFYAPKWSTRIHEEWTRNLATRFADKSAANDAAPKIAAIRSAMDRTFPDALVTQVLPESSEIVDVDEKDRHVVMTAVAARADAIVTFNLKDFAAEQLELSLRIEVKHPDVFIRDLIDLNEKRALAAFRDLRARKRRPPWSVDELLERLIRAGLVQTSAWLSSADVLPLL